MKKSMFLCISAVVSVYGAEKGQEPQKDQKDQQVIIQKAAEQIAKEKKEQSPFADPGHQARQATADREPSSPSKTPSEAPKPKDDGRPERYSSGNWKRW